MFDDVKHPVFEVKGLAVPGDRPEIILQSISSPKSIREHRHLVGDSLDFVQSFLDLLREGYRLDTEQGRAMIAQSTAAMKVIFEENEFFTKVYREVITHLESEKIYQPKEK